MSYKIEANSFKVLRPISGKASSRFAAFRDPIRLSMPSHVFDVTVLLWYFVIIFYPFKSSAHQDCEYDG